MLRVSSQASGEHANLESIVAGSSVDSGVAGNDSLLRFAEAALDRDNDAIASARAAVVNALGEPAMIDAAGVIANFQRMVRIADGTGIPLDEPVAALTADIRDQLSLNDYGSAANTPPVAFWKRWLARLLRPLLPRMLPRLMRPPE